VLPDYDANENIDRGIKWFLVSASDSTSVIAFVSGMVGLIMICFYADTPSRHLRVFILVRVTKVTISMYI